MYVTVEFVAAGLASEVTCPEPLKTGWSGLPSALTPVWPGKEIDTGSDKVFFRVMVTSAPSGTQSVGPGSWNAPLEPA